MAHKLLLDLLSSSVGIDNFQRWISGNEIPDITISLNRTEFVLFVLNYIQEQTNKYITLPPSSSATKTQVTKTEEKASTKNISDKESKVLEDESPQRVPFNIINRESPSKTPTRPFARHLSHGNETRRDLLHCSTFQESRSIPTSTPVHYRKTNSRNDHFPTSPPGSFHSDQGSFTHTPKSSKNSGTRYNSSSGSHHFSPQSNSPSFSPSSPHYSDAFPDLSGRGRSRTLQSPCLADFITSKPTSQKARKRIKPTQLSTPNKEGLHESKKGSKSFGVVDHPFVPNNSYMQSELKEKANFDEERSLIKQKRIQCLNFSPDSSISNSSSSSLNKKDTVNSFDIEKNNQSINNSLEVPPLPLSAVKSVEPKPNLVTDLDKILILATIYGAFLDANLVPNLTSELSFVFTILTTSFKIIDHSISSPSKKKVLRNTETLNSNNKHYNDILDNLCLEDKVPLLMEISREDNQIENHDSSNNECVNVLNSVHNIVMFATAVIEKQLHVLECLDKSVTKLLLDNRRILAFAPLLIEKLSQICASKESNEAILTPSKQLPKLENGPVLYHSETDSIDNFPSQHSFNFFKKQRDGFYGILHEWNTKNSDIMWVSKRFPFKVQNLLGISSDPVNMMHLARLFCSQLTSYKSEPNIDDLNLPGVPKDKLSRLQARLSKPQDQNSSPRPPLQFPGEQQFYKQFLQNVTGSSFVTHVLDCLIYRLHLLNNTDFFVEGLSLEESKLQIQVCVSNCCLLAKFIGLIVFSPYKSEHPSPVDTLQAQVEVRQQVVPPVNFVAYLQRAVVAKRLVVTLPWIVTFLGMMDFVTPHLITYRQLLQLLVSIYRSLPLPYISSSATLLLRCSLGWLFDVSYFPENLFFDLILNSTKSDLLPVQSTDYIDVDVKDVVDQNLLSEVCPFLSHFRLLLSASSSLKQGSAKHITPVAAHQSPSTKPTHSIAHTIQFQLEESFLNGQATSFRSTVDFVVDRISSSCNKYICSNVIAPCKEEALSLFNKRKEEIKKMSKQEMQTWLTELCQSTQMKIDVAINDHCGPKISAVLSILLGPDANYPTLLQTTLAICSRRCRERIINWLNSHINLIEMYSKLVPAPDSKPPADSLMKPLQDIMTKEHRDSATPPADIIILLQDTICDHIQNSGSILNEEQALDIINRTLETVKFRSDLIAVAEHMIFSTTVDFCIVLLAYSPAVVTEAVLKKFCSLWSVCSQSGNQLERIISSRNVLLLCQSGSNKAQQSWQHLSCLLVELLKGGLLTPRQLETQCVTVFRLDWPPMVFNLIGSCLSSVLEQIKEDPLCKGNPKFILMLEWVNEMTKDLSKDESFDDG